MKITIEIPEKINKKLDIEKKELKIKSKPELIIYILGNYYGLK